MVAIIQNVLSASLKVDGVVVSEISDGAIVFVGINQNDTNEDAQKLALKLSKIRMFPDKEDKINLNLQDAKKEIMLVSNFTLNADVSKQNRPSFSHSAAYQVANEMFETVCIKLQNLLGQPVKKGVFGGDMKINTELDGPINIILNTNEL